ncbi:MAG: ParB/RepB/Spo0J family partition protein [Clostridia bacterium]|nr:ParB/RepB/Spo0J family partition protein [Clostridia bacterium]
MALKGLGRGLDALLADNDITEKEQNGVTMLKISDVEPNRGQARRQFDETALLELADSIGKHGILQPIAVRKKANGYYEIIAGERRWRASKIAGLSEIPALVKEIDDQSASELSLIENLQRENLNAVEEAYGYRDLMEKFDLTQEEAAERVGKSRASVANVLRLLKLPSSVLSLVENDSLSYGHARTLIPLTQRFDEKAILEHAEYVVKCAFSVRQTEQYVKNLLDGGKRRTSNNRSNVSNAYYKKIENDMSEVLGRKANIKQDANGNGKVTIAFSGSDDLEDLIKQICGELFFTDEN